MSAGCAGVGTNAQDGESELVDADGCAMAAVIAEEMARAFSEKEGRLGLPVEFAR